MIDLMCLLFCLKMEKIMKTKKIRPAGSFLILAICMIVIAISSCSKKKVGATAIVIMTNGTVEKISSQKNTVPLRLKDTLTKGDIVKTGPESFIVIQIGDDILARIQPDSNVEVKTLFDQENTEIFLEKGQIISVVKKFSKENNFNIKTPTALAAVRGTEYSISFYKGRSVLAVKEGKVQLSSLESKGKNKELMVETGNTVIISADMAKRPINDFESLEIDKMKNFASITGDDLQNDKVFEDLAKKAQDDDKRITEEILKRGGPIPATTEEMLKKFGRLNDVTLYSGKRYTGVILEHGEIKKIMTVEGIISVPSKQIRFNKIIR